MRDDDEDPTDPDLDSDLDEESLLQTQADVTCPYCGEPVTLELDAGSGEAQEYVEDCPVCCRPWQVHVHYDATGAADVTLEES
jgi:transposase-like protein